MGFIKDLCRTITNILGFTKPGWKEKKLYGGMEEFHKTNDEIKKMNEEESRKSEKAMQELLELERQDTDDKDTN